MPEEKELPRGIAPVQPPRQYEEPEHPFLVQVDDFLWVSRARRAFQVSGKGLTVAVLDTGLNIDHVDFAGRVVAQRNFTADNGGNPEDATDGNGHGTNVGGIIVADGDHLGIAPEANIIPVKVLDNHGGGIFSVVGKALDWVLENREAYNITAVCMSLADGGNYASDDDLEQDALRHKIQALRDQKVAVVIAAGNHYYDHGSQQGMGYPAIIRECVSVGAVYDAPEGPFQYGDAVAYSTRAGQITPFSQRLHPDVNPNTYTDIFAPGAPVTSSGIMGPHGESTQHGTSQATPVTAGLILLIQHFYQQATGELPDVDHVVTMLRWGGVPIHDGDDEDDNVKHTDLDFVRADALSALDAVRRALQKRRLEEGVGTG